MAKVFFKPNKAIKYTGSKAKEFLYSLEDPKPKMKKGDIVIVSIMTAFNLIDNIPKPRREYEYIDDIEFVKADKDTAVYINELETKIKDSIDLEIHTDVLKENQELQKKIESLEAELKKARETQNEKGETDTFPTLDQFNGDKDSLEEVARGYGIELDKRASIEDMYRVFVEQYALKDEE